MPERLMIYCDESTLRGKHFSHFYGAVLVRERDLGDIERILNGRKNELNLAKEVKFTKITQNYQSKYMALIETFFRLIADGRVKVRIMFSQNIHAPLNLTTEQQENTYFLLYYQLIKHAFGLQYVEGNEPISLRLSLDQLPDNKSKIVRFKRFLCALEHSTDFQARQISIAAHDITEVESHKHTVLQCLDIVLGAMQFKLNGHDKEIPEGKHRRAKRTVAKDTVYKAINKEIRKLYPGYAFNIGVSTRKNPGLEYRWKDPYRHWLFIPREHGVNQDYVPKK